VKTTAILAAALALAGTSGFFASKAIGIGSQQPTRTVTIDVGTGAQGQPGPAGPPGPKGDPGTPGAESCPAGYSFAALVIIQQGKGPTQIATCIKD
jgi:hypothetical protein